MRSYKAGIIGCGRIAGSERREYTHAEAYKRHPQTELVYAFDANLIKHNKFHERWDICQQPIDNCDIVSICTPDDQHIADLKWCLEYPNIKAVWCEKPICHDPEEAIDIVYEYQKAGKKLCVNYQRRWAEWPQKKNIYYFYIGYTGSLWCNGSHGVDLILSIFGPPNNIELIGKPGEPINAKFHYDLKCGFLQCLHLPNFHFNVSANGKTIAENQMYDLYPVLDDIVNNKPLRSNGFTAVETARVCQWLLKHS